MISPIEKKILLFYQAELDRLKVVPNGNGAALERCATLVKVALSQLREEEPRLVDWMLGFIQGVLWKEGLFTFDQIVSHWKGSQNEIKQEIPS
jgi:hypothetical protein